MVVSQHSESAPGLRHTPAASKREQALALVQDFAVQTAVALVSRITVIVAEALPAP